MAYPIRYGLRVLSALAAVLLLAGCWDRKELNDISVVTGMAVDKGREGRYRLSIEAVNVASLNPKRGGDLAPSVIYSLEGPTLEETFHRMNEGISRVPILSHMRVLVISEELARERPLNFIDFLQRNREIRNDFSILIAKGGNAKEVLTMSYPLQKVATSKLNKQLRTLKSEWGGSPDVRLDSLIEAYEAPGRQPVVGYVSIAGTKPERQEDNIRRMTPALVRTEGMAVFRDLKMVGVLNQEDVRNFLWTQNKIDRTSLTVPLKSGAYMGVRIIHSRSGIKTRMNGSKPLLEVTVRLEGVIEALQTGVGLEDLARYEQLEQTVSRMLEKKIRLTVVKAQKEFRADIFGFGDALYRRYPSQFRRYREDWDDAFARGDVVVRVRTVLARTGTIRSPVFVGKDDSDTGT